MRTRFAVELRGGQWQRGSEAVHLCAVLRDVAQYRLAVGWHRLPVVGRLGRLGVGRVHPRAIRRRVRRDRRRLLGVPVGDDNAPLLERGGYLLARQLGDVASELVDVARWDRVARLCDHLHELLGRHRRAFLHWRAFFHTFSICAFFPQICVARDTSNVLLGLGGCLMLHGRCRLRRPPGRAP
jgi:hypothetical protein